jgi:hypothetical protein
MSWIRKMQITTDRGAIGIGEVRASGQEGNQFFVLLLGISSHFQHLRNHETTGSSLKLPQYPAKLGHKERLTLKFSRT